MEAHPLIKSEVAPILDSNVWLYNELEALSNHPHESLITMQAALSIKLAERLGFDDGLIDDDPDTFRAMELTPKQYEGIKSFEEIARVFSGHSTLTIDQFSVWLTGPESRLGYHAPISILFARLSDEGFNKVDMRSFMKSAERFFRPGDGGYEAIWKLL